MFTRNYLDAIFFATTLTAWIKISMNRIKVRSSIKDDLKRYTLFRGTFLALLGIIPILVTGTSMPPDLLNLWGLPIFIVGGALITWGLLPYRRLCRRETKPSEIIVDDQENLTYIVDDRVKLTLLLDQIQQLKFEKKGKLYGISIQLKNCDQRKAIFLPYFPESSARKLSLLMKLPD